MDGEDCASQGYISAFECRWVCCRGVMKRVCGDNVILLGRKHQMIVFNIQRPDPLGRDTSTIVINVT